jgi:hypothetical protein
MASRTFLFPLYFRLSACSSEFETVASRFFDCFSYLFGALLVVRLLASPVIALNHPLDKCNNVFRLPIGDFLDLGHVPEFIRESRNQNDQSQKRRKNDPRSLHAGRTPCTVLGFDFCVLLRGNRAHANRAPRPQQANVNRRAIAGRTLELRPIEYLAMCAIFTVASIIRYSSGFDDSRHGLGGYYRYQPRRIVPLLAAVPRNANILRDIRYLRRWLKNPFGKDPQSDADNGLDADSFYSPKIHESVFRRIAAGTDGYSPIVIPAAYRVTKKADKYCLATTSRAERIDEHEPADKFFAETGDLAGSGGVARCSPYPDQPQFETSKKRSCSRSLLLELRNRAKILLDLSESLRHSRIVGDPAKRFL